jgi:hypothetical protein
MPIGVMSVVIGTWQQKQKRNKYIKSLSMKLATKTQIAIFHAILARTGQMEAKPEIISSLSDGRASSTKELYQEELESWINAYNAASKPVTAVNPGQKMINSIIAMAHDIGFIKKKQMVVGGIGGKKVNDYTDLNKWMLERGYLKKPLNQYKYEELPKLVSQFKGLYMHQLKK